MSATHSDDVKKGERFEFGKNWNSFLSVLSEERVLEAERSLKEMLKVETLAGKTFLDIGSGSGLFSLAAMRLNAAKVHSLDYDPNSVACAMELKRRYFTDSERWTIQQGSALDRGYLDSLGKFDVVYSWGVLHHTGNMWLGLENAKESVADDGDLFIAIYNDQGFISRVWTVVKKFYNKGVYGRWLIIAMFVPLFVVRGVLKDILLLKNPIRRYREYKQGRGMSVYYDWFDWLGGYPFEVATTDVIIEYYKKHNFELINIIRREGMGCNEFVFRKQD